MLSAFRTRELEGSCSAPEHWGGTEPFRILAPDGTAVGDTDVGLDPDELRGTAAVDGRGPPPGPRVHRAAAPGRADGLPGLRGPGGRPDRVSAIALGADDFVFPTFRELAVALVRGVDAVQYLQYHRGTWHGGPYDPRATRFGPICIPIATQIVHAVGYALGTAARRHATACTVAYFGDGSDERGRLPRGREPRGRLAACRPCCSARTTAGRSACRPTQQTAGEIWKRAEGYGFPGVRVDGNDVLAVYRGDARGRGAGARGRGTDPDRGADLPDRRALDGRRRRALPRRRRGRGGARVRPDRAVPRRGCAPRAIVDDAFVRGVRGGGRGRSRSRSARA